MTMEGRVFFSYELFAQFQSHNHPLDYVVENEKKRYLKNHDCIS